MNRRQYIALSAVIVLIAFLLREWYALAAHVDIRFRGDVQDYVRYAFNIADHATFSKAKRGTELVADAYRNPGWPLMLAGIIKATPETWYRWAIQAQVVMGTATVGLTIAIGRQWLPRGACLFAGLLLALWPHHVVASGSLLSEVAFGFMLALSLLLAMQRRAVGTGLALGATYLVNPIAALLPVLVAWHWRDKRKALVMLSLFGVAFGGWALRNATVPDGPSRVAVNFVQGSWPEYHESYRWREILTVAHDNSLAIDAATRTAETDPAQAVSDVADRMASDPAKFAGWYLSKPYELWGWDIQMGEGGIYFLRTTRSPYEGPIHWMEVTAWLLNPALFALALGFSLWAFWRRRPEALPALVFLYLTALHVVLQAEPRYANAYRGIEMLAAVGGLTAVLDYFRRRSSAAQVWLSEPRRSRQPYCPES